MQNFTTAAQIELGDAFGLSPASCEWIAESIMTGPVAAVPSESAVTDRLIREICYLEGKDAAATAYQKAVADGITDWSETSALVEAARDTQYKATGQEAEKVAKELGLR